jgi:hypothetical protein
MGLLFQPRWPCDGFPIGDRAAGREEAPDRGRVFLLALEAVLLGDASHYGDVFTDDVEMRGPHLEVTSLASLQRAVGSPEDSLTDVAVTVADVLAPVTAWQANGGSTRRSPVRCSTATAG